VEEFSEFFRNAGKPNGECRIIQGSEKELHMIAYQALGPFFIAALLVCSAQAHGQSTTDTSAGVTGEHLSTGETIAVPDALPRAALEAEVDAEVDESLKDADTALDAEPASGGEATGAPNLDID
jgi:hypothetical protein